MPLRSLWRFVVRIIQSSIYRTYVICALFIALSNGFKYIAANNGLLGDPRNALVDSFKYSSPVKRASHELS